jgi:iron complex outermembrane recepter protein
MGFRTLCLAVLMGASALPAFAQAIPEDGPGASDGLGEIVVRARRRDESQQQVSVAVTTISPDQLQRRGNFNPLDLQQLAPGLTVQAPNADKTNYFFTIRGQAFTTGTLYSAVLPYFAEVPFTRLSPGQFFDLKNIEVLRGPQGTLFGRVTNGGAILLQPVAPGDRFEGYVNQQFGSYDLHTTDGAVTLPVVEGLLSFRGAFEIGRQDGYVRNINDGRELSGTHHESIRGSLLFTPTPDLENLLIVNYHHANETGADSRLSYVNPPAILAGYTRLFGATRAREILAQLQSASAAQLARGPTHTELDSAPANRRSSTFVVNRTTFKITPDITFRNIFGYMQFRQFNVSDYEGSILPVVTNLSPIFPSNLDDREQYSNEVQIQAKLVDGKLDLTMGFYIDKSKNGGPTESYSVNYGVLRNIQVQSIEAKSLAFYGQASYALDALLEGLKANGGLRYTRDKAQGFGGSYLATLASEGPNDPVPHGQCLDDVSGLTGLISAAPCLRQSSKISTTTYMYGLDWQMNPKMLVYGKISRGYRPGGFNFVPLGAVAATYQPEFNLSREIGIKADWSIGNVDFRTNLSAFYDTKSNIQVRASIPIALTNYSAVLNTNRSTIKGLEFEGIVRPFVGLIFITRWAHTVAHNDLSGYTPEYIAAACPANPYTTAPDNSKPCPLNKIARLPREVVGLEARYEVDLPGDRGNLSFGINHEYTSSQWGTDANAITPDVFKPRYSLINADARWTGVFGSTADLSLFATNLANKKYISSSGSVAQMGSLGVGQITYGAPRIIGGAIRVRFGE